ncbi:bifunctional sugar-binding transcriptional regulator/dihydroxyacetone kinase subunit DhaK [Tropicimonas sp. IMCC6043]|uniref:bifunctional sugar-binding transcriptional regulator/dihydroxyacetone kinase subunit DhaK n=1 Tax=Tropicimonas sp. IMCC6043 TaxID=2510645 RepID=UPI00101CA106|nr:bifunctional sugar-binding transcriptional regulator/dihydroxyacetone kinase subunit DhaK [Tropicimonas sp. IMCC6043]RYH11594.1 bifunctional sugar-binding transcriptional regulator/dihydroxyacetone kinase subunit DhaK [Tropicimonas sp. IMCC6043]
MPPRSSSGSARGADAGAGVPLRFGDDLLLWASWLYYEEGMTQSDIARIIGVSRASVISYLADARTRGIVNISIETNRLRALSVARSLSEHFGLKDCLVIPSTGGERPLVESLGAAGAQALRALFRSGDTIGVGWGRSVLAAAKALSTEALQDIRVVQVTGSTSAHVPYTPAACATAMAAAIGAECIPLSAPAIVSTPELRDLLCRESPVREQLACLAELNRIVLGIASMRPSSTLHASGLLKDGPMFRDAYAGAVGEIAGHFVDARGLPVSGPLEARMIGITLEDLARVPQRIAIAGGVDKVPAILAALRGGHANVLVTDAATGAGILHAEGLSVPQVRPGQETVAGLPVRTRVKKFLNAPDEAVDEALEGAVADYAGFLRPVRGSNRALVALDGPRPGKVGVVIGGGAGHDPCFLGYVGRGMADAVAIGNVFASPPPGPILDATRAADGGAGVLHLFGNYSGDVMNFEMAAEMADSGGIAVRTLVTTDDVASAGERQARRGVAGNVLVFKAAGAAADRMLPLVEVAALARKANDRSYTIGVALEPCSLPETQRPLFAIGAGEMEVGVGIHGEPGVARQALENADDTADLVVDRILTAMDPKQGDEVALLLNSLGATPLMELHIIGRRVRQRLKARGVVVARSWAGHYCTSLDMVGMSVTMMHLDAELKGLLDHPCHTPAFRVAPVATG